MEENTEAQKGEKSARGHTASKGSWVCYSALGLLREGVGGPTSIQPLPCLHIIRFLGLHWNCQIKK